MEANSKRIIVDESSNSEAESEIESETTKSEWEETVNMAANAKTSGNQSKRTRSRYIGESYGNRE
jgi:hypothetical protein